jgi:hypothetical protein
MREDLIDVITNIAPTDTPFVSGLKVTRAAATKHEWLKDTLEARGSKATAEGASTSYSDITAPTRDYNVIEQIEVTWQISDMAIATTHAGMKDLLAYEIAKQSKVWKNALEYDAINGTLAAGSEGVAATMKGALGFISTNSLDAETAALDEVMYNNLAEDIWEQGGNPKETFVNGYLKRKISAFTANATKTVEAADKRLVNAVDVYVSDFGMQKVMLCRDMPKSADDAELMIIDPSVWALAYLINPHTEERAKTRSATNGVIIGSCTIECREEKANGKIINLSTTS